MRSCDNTVNKRQAQKHVWRGDAGASNLHHPKIPQIHMRGLKLMKCIPRGPHRRHKIALITAPNKKIPFHYCLVLFNPDRICDCLFWDSGRLLASNLSAVEVKPLKQYHQMLWQMMSWMLKSRRNQMCPFFLSWGEPIFLNKWQCHLSGRGEPYTDKKGHTSVSRWWGGKDKYMERKLGKMHKTHPYVKDMHAQNPKKQVRGGYLFKLFWYTLMCRH